MKFMRKLHRWLSLIIIIQVLIWLISGFYFSWLGHQKLAAHDYFQSAPATPVGSAFYPENALFERFNDIKSIEIRSVGDTPQYVVITTAGTSHYVNALTGEDWTTSAPLAAELARKSYNGPGRVKEVQAVKGSDEIIGWQDAGFKVTFSDDLATRVYVDSASGNVVDHRNSRWWLSDWMFRLHFMDYSGERDFNSLLNIIAATVALWFSLSGLILLGRSLKRRQLF
ncbi:PepSY domain-containing protein [Idiomarina sp. HP20-50]|uniref:PepSY domain-containing protein n=1 Tax=Idiomarina sp. HP20-50 TaxID=3070813 RepID=UPI00294ABE39|nr:PepSY domain-containing protein [Idiomarina sp. HP20-50]MDV6316611.1 PepSY domain-containing protein [Idiomarina sp. HP20-50]